MRTDNIKVRLTIPIPFDRPDLNGAIYTKEAIDKAITNMPSNTPILYKDNDCEAKVVGVIDEPFRSISFDSKNQVCTLSLNGTIFYAGASIIANEIEDGKITDFEIRSIGLTV